MARGAGVTVEIGRDAPALLDGAAALAASGVRTGASTRNWQAYGAAVDLPDGLDDWRRDLLTDPQTSGGLLIAVAEDEAADLMALAAAEGLDRAVVVGRVLDGPARVRVA
jgi:selenide,water dikinase